MSTITVTITPADALAEITRRAQGSKVPAADRFVQAMSGAELRDLAGIPQPQRKTRKGSKTKASAKVQTERAPHPMKGKSRLGLTPEQQTRAQELYSTIGGGAAYHEACKAEGIPTTKNGLASV